MPWKSNKTEQKELKHLSNGILLHPRQHTSIGAFVTLVSSVVSRIFHSVLDSEALRYDKAVHLKSSKRKKEKEKKSRNPNKGEAKRVG